jgi:S1-C subfamily serine protease
LILYRTPTETMPAPSLQITGVEGNAKKAGVKRGDYLAEYDGKKINSLDDLRAAIGAAAKTEGKIPIVVYRGVKRVELELDPGKMGVNLSSR